MDPTRWPLAPHPRALAQQKSTDRLDDNQKAIVGMLIAATLLFTSGCEHGLDCSG